MAFYIVGSCTFLSHVDAAERHSTGKFCKKEELDLGSSRTSFEVESTHCRQVLRDGGEESRTTYKGLVEGLVILGLEHHRHLRTPPFSG